MVKMKSFNFLQGLIYLPGIYFYFIDGVMIAFLSFMILQVHLIILLVLRDLNLFITKKIEEEIEKEEKKILEKYQVLKIKLKIREFDNSIIEISPLT